MGTMGSTVFIRTVPTTGHSRIGRRHGAVDRPLPDNWRNTVKAPAEHQQRLLTLQGIDRDIARTKYQRDHLPQIASIQELTARAKDLHRSGVRAATKLADQKRIAQVTEGDMRRVQARLEVQRGRLAAGKGKAKELTAIQHEVEKLVDRETELAEKLRVERGEIEATERIVRSVKTQGQGMLADIKDLETRKNREMQTLNARIQGLEAQRSETAAGLDDELLTEYEYLRDRSGGLGVIGVRGRCVVDSSLQFSAAEWERIVQSPADEVFISEDHDVIVVRLGECD